MHRRMFTQRLHHDYYAYHPTLSANLGSWMFCVATTDHMYTFHTIRLHQHSLLESATTSELMVLRQSLTKHF